MRHFSPLAVKLLFVAATLLGSLAAAGGVVFATSGANSPATPTATCPSTGRAVR